MNDLTYRDLAIAYWASGWRGVLPLPARKKMPVPEGYTGKNGDWTELEQITEWSTGSRGGGNLGLRMPDWVVGIDVDAYGDKVGDLSWMDLIEECGDPPATWISTSRPEAADGHSGVVAGIRYYRVPPGTGWRKAKPPEHIDIIRAAHRYAVVYPSIHPSGNQYVWIDPDGNLAGNSVPSPQSLPELPKAWMDRLFPPDVREPPASPTEPEPATLSIQTGLGPIGAGSVTDAVGKSYAEATFDRSIADLATLAEGSRNNRLNEVAYKLGTLVPAFYSYEQVWNGLYDACVSNGLVGDDGPDAVRATIKSGLDAGQLEPRAVRPEPIEQIPVLKPTPTAGPPTTAEPPTGDTTPVTVEVEEGQEEGDGRRPEQARILDGATFLLGQEDSIDLVWGTEDEGAYWAEGEALMIVGPPGVGKSTLCGQLVFAKLGLLDSVLDLPVNDNGGKILYLAMDRPKQIQRGLRRLAKPEHEDVLRDRLVVWRGPLPFDPLKDKNNLATFAQENECSTIIVDSLKDLVTRLSDDENATLYNNARQECVARGIEILELHHQRKAGSDGKKPKDLDAVFGSRMLTAGAGSVIMLWGESGDPVVEMELIKTLQEKPPSMFINHNYDTGISSVHDKRDAYTVLNESGEPKTIRQIAARIYLTTEPKLTASQVESARRQVKRLVGKGTAQANGTDPETYQLYDTRFVPRMESA